VIVDAFPYALNPEALLIRLRELRDIVTTHILVEADYTYAGEPREYAWPKLLRDDARFAEFRKRVHHVPMRLPDDLRPSVSERGSAAAWRREGFIRDRTLAEAHVWSTRGQEGAIVLFGDHDEIPNPLAIEFALAAGRRGRLLCRYYEWYLNVRAVDSPAHLWEAHQPLLMGGRDILGDTGQRLRASSQYYPLASSVLGWHYTLQGSAEDVHDKLAGATAHTELNTITLNEIRDRRDNLLDILDRCPLEIVPDTALPASVQSRMDEYRWKDLIR
jgi:hypothetical protein